MGVGQGVEESCPGRHCCAVLSWEPRLSASRTRSLETGSGSGCLWLPQGLPHEVPCVQGVCSGLFWRVGDPNVPLFS